VELLARTVFSKTEDRSICPNIEASPDKLSGLLRLKDLSLERADSQMLTDFIS
jgi:hypothetical protein